ncbi:MAG: L-carnitine dehydratase/bile acid-inducible protein [Actinomycetia bacterium]|nr:L-carnitine dehydratase/bile acid-inducible protein [Actinomycetes bacterium]
MADAPRPVLDGVRVVDLTCGTAGPYCTKLLADAGADVVVVEPATGADERRVDPGRFDFLHTSKRSVSEDAAVDLVERADIVVADAGFDVDAARARNPALVVVSITPFGLSGPWVGRPATEFTMQASCGSTGGRGLPDRPPLAAGGGIGEWQAGSYAAVGALAAWMGARSSGVGRHVDVAVFDCMAIGMVTFPSVFAEFAAAAGSTPPFASLRRIEVPSIEPTADGYVCFTTNSAQQFSDFAVLIGRPELADDKDYVRAGPRFNHREKFWAMAHAYTQPRSSAEVMEEASVMRIPVAPVLDPSTIMGFPQFAERGVFVEHPGGRFRQPRVPYRLSGRERPGFRPVPEPAADDGSVEWPPRPAAGPGPARLPLDGVRVVDLTAWWAGPCAAQVLGSLGADVIKVESVKRPDLMRLAGPKTPTDPLWAEWGPLAHAANTNKRGITIDLTRPEGRDLALQLIATADVVIENYTPRVMEQFDLGWDRLHELNPSLNLVRMPAFGLDGPWRDHPGFAQTMESLTGLAWATGWPDGKPTLVGGAGDPIAGLHATYATMIALVARETGGEGVMVESTMVEAVLNAAASLVIEHQLTGATGTRAGNRSPVPSMRQGVYPGAGDDRWVAIAADGEDEWQRVARVLGDPGLAQVADVDGWDARLAELTVAWSSDDLADRLIEVGVAAATVIAPRDLAANPQLVHRGLFEIEDHPVTGARGMPGLPFRMSGVERWLQRPAPTLGQHNHEVFAAIGVGDDELDALERSGIIGDRLAT